MTAMVKGPDTCFRRSPYRRNQNARPSGVPWGAGQLFVCGSDGWGSGVTSRRGNSKRSPDRQLLYRLGAAAG